MALSLTIGAVIVICCIVFNKISNKIGVPMLFAFILLGMLFGSDGIFKIEFENFEFAEQICSVALIFIIFYGGFGTKWATAKKVAAKSLVLSSAGTLLTALLTGLFCHFVLRFSLAEGMLIGAVLSSTDAASVFNILRSKNLNLKYGTASILELESGSNDPWAYMLTVIILSVMSGGVSGWRTAYMLFAQVVYGIGLGAIIALGAVWALKHVEFDADGFDTIFIVAVAVFSYALPSLVGGNGYLSCYLVGIVLGNSKIKSKKVQVHFFDGLTGLMQILLFFLLGLLSFPSQIPKIIIPALLIAVTLTFVVRPLTVSLLMLPFKAKLNQIAVVSWAGLRGATSIVFAILAIVSDAYTKSDVFHIVFCVVLLSIGIQGTLLPKVSEKLNMIDNDDSVMKTFTDYSNETEIQFIRLNIKKNHPWINLKVKDINLPPETLLVMVYRGGRTVIPRGGTIVLEGDVLVLSAVGYEPKRSGQQVLLSEEEITEDSEWQGRTIAEAIPRNVLVVMIKRNEKTVIPNGNTKIKPGDVLVLHTSDKELLG
ncbi:potassium/proton antiporter [Ruminococcus sp. Marseille-P6503]|uniref:potassium/proton antiporter n=1 Tax=Ruminococcus sp. Marseille-P6503 TaxID=2364796 RepID=UPI000F53916C|nr:potassium/proton antiporter [Ruminococcus sp. Marseille-P6503]